MQRVQAQSDLAFTRERLEMLKASADTHANEVLNLRSRAAAVSAQVSGLEEQLANATKELVSAKEAEKKYCAAVLCSTGLRSDLVRSDLRRSGTTTGGGGADPAVGCERSPRGASAGHVPATPYALPVLILRSLLPLPATGRPGLWEGACGTEIG
eukprot:1706413-Rhodomonas_salina.1